MIKRVFLSLVMTLVLSIAAHAAYAQLRYYGTIAGKNVEVALAYNTGDAFTNFRSYFPDDGAYRYVGFSGVMRLVPRCEPANKTWVFDEYSPSGKRTGRWTVKAKNGTLKGTFTSPKGKKYNINLYESSSTAEWEWAY